MQSFCVLSFVRLLYMLLRALFDIMEYCKYDQAANQRKKPALLAFCSIVIYVATKIIRQMGIQTMFILPQ